MPTVSTRLSDEELQQLEKLAVATGRKKGQLIGLAITDYLEREAWQIQEIQQALTEADADDFADDKQVNTVFKRYGAS